MTGRRRLVVVLGTTLVAFAATVVVASLLRDGPAQPAEVPDLNPEDLTGVAAGPARELLALVARGRGLVHHAAYEESGGDRYEVWVDGRRAREDVTPVEGDRRVILRTETEKAYCVESPAGWRCRDAGAEAPGVRGRLAQLAPELAGIEVTVQDDRIAGHPARCFAAASPEAPVQICLTLDGALARLGVDEKRLEMVELNHDVDRDVFRVPGRRAR